MPDINKHIIDYLQGLGTPVLDVEYRANLDMWRDWYRGKVDSFHQYTVFNGIRTIKCERASLQMAKTVCEDWANLLLNERVQISVDDERQQQMLDALLDTNEFWKEGNNAIERAFALGTAAFSEYLGADGVPKVDYHSAAQIWPLRYSGADVSECAFSSVIGTRDDKRVFLRIYKFNGGVYVLENHCLDYESGRSVPLPEGIAASINTGLTVRPFQIFKPNIANNIDFTSPLGISVFANAIDSLMGVDAVYDSYRNEFILGRKRLLVPQTMTQIARTQDGDRTPIFDPNDMVFTAYQPTEDMAAGFHDLSPEIRAEQHMQGMRAQLNLLSMKCGLGTGRYEFDRQAGVKTATEVVSEQSELYQTMCKHEIALREALEGLARALLTLAGFKRPDVVRIVFDDSVIQDKTAQRSEAREEVAAGLMSKWRYLTQVCGMGDQEAEAELERIRSESSITAEAVDFFNVHSAE